MESLDSLFSQLEPFKGQPLNKWHPAKSVDIDIRIDRKGDWFYQGSPITRHRIVKLFATVLRLEEDTYYLVTPPLKYRIQVEDVPFNAVEMKQTGKGVTQELHLRTNMDDVMLINSDHPVRMFDKFKRGSLVPYVHVRDGLQARVVRSVYYQLAELVEQNPWNVGACSLQESKLNACNLDNQDSNNKVEIGVVSAGEFFPMDSITVK